MTITKAYIVNHLTQNGGLGKNDAIRITEDLIELMKKHLESGDSILISGFGKFSVKAKRARRGRNPHTGDDLILEPRRVVTFHPSGILRDKVIGKARS